MRARLTNLDFERLHSGLWSQGEETKFAQRAPWLHSKLQSCMESHTACLPKPCLPSRLIDTMLGEPIGDPRLINTDALSASSVKYTALSHCWGQTDSLPTSTTSQNVVRHLTGLSPEALTKNISDALQVTKILGIRYIWIDSLCIIQDDRADWEREAAKMAEIYQGSEITIIANDSADAHGGLHLNLSSSTVITKRSDGVTAVALRQTTHGGSIDAIEKAPIRARAWVLQEVLLSNRAVYFAADEMFWNCRCSFLSEDGYYGSVAASPAYRAIQQQTDPKWNDVVKNYSARQLSRWTDKIAAFSGISQFWSLKHHLTPVLGMWMQFLPSQLSWTTYPMRDIEVTPPGISGNIPSWSWLSHNNCHISFPYESEKDKAVDELKVVKFDQSWSGVPWTSTLLKTTLLVEGWLRTYCLTPESDTQSWAISDNSLPARETSKYRMSVQLNFDSQSDRMNEMSVQLLLLRTVKGKEYNNYHFSHFLIVLFENHLDGISAYRRHGTCEIRFESKAGHILNATRVRLKQDPSKLFKAGVTLTTLYLV